MVFLILMVFGTETDDGSGARIIGGKNATNIPWIVPLVYAGYPAWQGHYCGGSIIHEKWVLTAAHCVEFLTDPSELYVVGGVTDLEDVTDAQERNIISIHIHEEYDDYWLTNDVALLELESVFCFNDDVALIDVARANRTYGVGLEYSVAGWGATN